MTFVLAGRTMLLEQRTAEAEQFFGEALRLAPGDPELLTRLGIAKAALNKLDEADQLFRRALAIDPNLAPAVQALEKLRAGGRR